MNIIIYHAPDYVTSSGRRGKVGATKNLKRRIARYRKNGYSGQLTILEQLQRVTPKQAADAEWRWAIKLGYKHKGWRYDQTLKAVKRAGAANIRSGHWARIQSLGGFVGGKIGGPIGGRIAVKSGQLRRAAVLGGKVQGAKNARSGWMKKISQIAAAQRTTAAKAQCV